MARTAQEKLTLMLIR